VFEETRIPSKEQQIRELAQLRYFHCHVNNRTYNRASINRKTIIWAVDYPNHRR